MANNLVVNKNKLLCLLVAVLLVTICVCGYVEAQQGPNGGGSGGGSGTPITSCTGAVSGCTQTGAVLAVTSAGPISVATVSLTANQINHLFSAPVTLVAAPGAGKVIQPLSVSSLLKAGTIPFGKGGLPAAAIGTFYGTNAHPTSYALDAFTNNLVDTVITDIASGAIGITSSVGNNAALIAGGTGDNFINGGAIVTSNLHVGSGGTGYAPGDTGGLNDCGATYAIDTAPGGVVATYHIVNPSFACPIITNEGTFTSTGVGDGNFAIDITAVTPGNGSGSVVVYYQTLTLP